MCGGWMVGNQNVVEFYGGSSLKETSIKSKGRFQNQMDGVSDFLPSNTFIFARNFQSGVLFLYFLLYSDEITEPELKFPQPGIPPRLNHPQIMSKRKDFPHP